MFLELKSMIVFVSNLVRYQLTVVILFYLHLLKYFSCFDYMFSSAEQLFRFLLQHIFEFRLEISIHVMFGCYFNINLWYEIMGPFQYLVFKCFFDLSKSFSLADGFDFNMKGLSCLHMHGSILLIWFMSSPFQFYSLFPDLKQYVSHYLVEHKFSSRFLF